MNISFSANSVSRNVSPSKIESKKDNFAQKVAAQDSKINQTLDLFESDGVFGLKEKLAPLCNEFRKQKEQIDKVLTKANKQFADAVAQKAPKALLGELDKNRMRLVEKKDKLFCDLRRASLKLFAKKMDESAGQINELHEIVFEKQENK